MTEQLNVQQMAERLCAADNILVLCHKNPDGDTIGCGSALCHALKALGKTAAVLCSDAVPSRYSFTAPVPFRGEFEPKTVVAVDVASVQLFGENNGVPQYTRHVDLCIDHHTGNSGYADFTLLDGNAAAAAELLYEVISEMGVEITPLIANCLYTGLATDTGCFLKFPHTGFHIGFIACIRNAIFQCVSLGGCIIIKIRHLIQAFCNITVHLPQRLVYTDNMCVLAISEISFPKLHFFSRQLFYRIFIVR